MTENDLCVRLYKSVPVIFEPPCINRRCCLRIKTKGSKPQLRPTLTLKWNNIYTSSNTTILCFINLNNGDKFLPTQAIIRPIYLSNLKCSCIQWVVRQCHGIPFTVALFFVIIACSSSIVCVKFNLLKPTGLVMHQPVLHSTTVRSAHTVFMCFVFIWEQTAICATYSINWLVFITEMKSVYSAVPTGSLNKAVCASAVKG